MTANNSHHGHSTKIIDKANDDDENNNSVVTMDVGSSNSSIEKSNSIVGNSCTESDSKNKDNTEEDVTMTETDGSCSKNNNKKSSLDTDNKGEDSKHMSAACSLAFLASTVLQTPTTPCTTKAQEDNSLPSSSLPQEEKKNTTTTKQPNTDDDGESVVVESSTTSSNNNMVDHTYFDYSIISEDILSKLGDYDESNDNESSSSSSVDKLKQLSEELFRDVDDEKLRKEKKERWIELVDMFEANKPFRKNTGGVDSPFPEKVMELLERSEYDGIISWLPHGRAFVVRNQAEFAAQALPRSKFTSFTRQLNLWGFKRITKNYHPDQGSYYHPLFLRGKPRLHRLMRRQKNKGTGVKLAPNPEGEPNFYIISEKRPLPPSKKDVATNNDIRSGNKGIISMNEGGVGLPKGITDLQSQIGQIGSNNLPIGVQLVGLLPPGVTAPATSSTLPTILPSGLGTDNNEITTRLIQQLTATNPVIPATNPVIPATQVIPAATVIPGIPATAVNIPASVSSGLGLDNQRATDLLQQITLQQQQQQAREAVSSILQQQQQQRNAALVNAAAAQQAGLLGGMPAAIHNLVGLTTNSGIGAVAPAPSNPVATVLEALKQQQTQEHHQQQLKLQQQQLQQQAVLESVMALALQGKPSLY